MKAENIQAEKLDIIDWILHLQDASLLKKIKSLRADTSEQKHVFTRDQKKAIDKGLKSLEKNGGIPHSEVMEQTKNRYPNLFK